MDHVITKSKSRSNPEVQHIFFPCLCKWVYLSLSLEVISWQDWGGGFAGELEGFEALILLVNKARSQAGM
jgi:hypothetical protein